jgi:DNA modification methylase
MIDIKLGDCLELMKDIPDHSVDMILTDLPYGITQAKWDMPIPFDKLWEQYNRVIKDKRAIVLFAQGLFTAKLIMSNEANYKYSLVWNKNHAVGFLNANRRPMSIHEDIVVFSRGAGATVYYPQKSVGRGGGLYRMLSGNKGAIYGKMPTDYIVDPNMKHPTSILNYTLDVNGSVFPTRKPVELLSFLIRSYTKEGELVLDSCIGSGSTIEAAMLLNRDAIGFELDPDNFALAQKMLTKANPNNPLTNDTLYGLF